MSAMTSAKRASSSPVARLERGTTSAVALLAAGFAARFFEKVCVAIRSTHVPANLRILQPNLPRRFRVH
jgi:hypothetical protein